MSLPKWLVNFGAIWDWIDRRQIIRRVMVLGTYWLTIHTILWMSEFAEKTDRTGADISVIFGAIGVPLTMLFGVMFTQYQGHRAKQEGDK